MVENGRPRGWGRQKLLRDESGYPESRRIGQGISGEKKQAHSRQQEHRDGSSSLSTSSTSCPGENL